MHKIQHIEGHNRRNDLSPLSPAYIRNQAETTIDLRDRRLPHGLGRQRSQSYLRSVRDEPLKSPDPLVGTVLRMVDVIGASAGLLALLPLLAAVWLVVGITSPGPVLFRHQRVGRSGRLFWCLKFRTMHHDAADQLDRLLVDPVFMAQWSEARKLKNDPRLTPVGRVLRRWDLDELPQLWNVLRGEMSLVGPRPVPEDEAELYQDSLRLVLSVRPGMTGLWQVSGRNELPYRQRIALDVRYVRTRSLGLNFRIVLRTLALLGRDRDRST